MQSQLSWFAILSNNPDTVLYERFWYGIQNRPTTGNDSHNDLGTLTGQAAMSRVSSLDMVEGKLEKLRLEVLDDEINREVWQNVESTGEILVIRDFTVVCVRASEHTVCLVAGIVELGGELELLEVVEALVAICSATCGSKMSKENVIKSKGKIAVCVDEAICMGSLEYSLPEVVLARAKLKSVKWSSIQ